MKKAISILILGGAILLSVTFVDGATLNVPSAQYPTIQSAINAANPGDTIILQAGTTFTEAVILKFKPGGDYITIQSSELSSLPPAGQRVNPTYSRRRPQSRPFGFQAGEQYLVHY